LNATGSVCRRPIIIHPILKSRRSIGARATAVTETGYRSHFLSPDDTDAAGGAVAYVIAALERHRFC
jgi:hypothetical protein